jgi:two-component system, LytTR family, response regulator
MIKCILVDDEQNSLEMMEWLLTTYCPQVEIVAQCENAEAGIAAIRQHQPDVVFLDIEMPRMNGFDMLEQLDRLNFEVVFCTAYDQFALRAFRYSALNYLLKPVDPDDLVETIRRIEARSMPPTHEQIINLLQTMRQPAAAVTPARIALTTSDGLIFVNTQDILYCEAESNYTKVVLTGGKKMVVAKVLKDIDETLSGEDFFRIHNSFLININHIKRFVRNDGGYVIMADEASIGISRSRRQAFMDMFPKF